MTYCIEQLNSNYRLKNFYFIERILIENNFDRIV
jgi:hypothetical protein